MNFATIRLVVFSVTILCSAFLLALRERYQVVPAGGDEDWARGAFLVDTWTGNTWTSFVRKGSSHYSGWTRLEEETP